MREKVGEEILRSHSALFTFHFTHHTLHFPIHTPHFKLYTLHSTLYTPHSTRHRLQFTLHTLHFTLHTSHSTLHTLHSTLHTPHSPLDTPHSKLYTPHLWNLYIIWNLYIKLIYFQIASYSLSFPLVYHICIKRNIRSPPIAILNAQISHLKNNIPNDIFFGYNFLIPQPASSFKSFAHTTDSILH